MLDVGVDAMGSYDPAAFELVRGIPALSVAASPGAPLKTWGARTSHTALVEPTLMRSSGAFSLSPRTQLSPNTGMPTNAPP